MAACWNLASLHDGNGQVKERNSNSNDISDGILALSWAYDRAVGGDDTGTIAAEYLLDGDVMNGNSDRTSSSV
jgi:hypothetical protein